MKLYVVQVADCVAVYNLEAETREEAEKEALELYKKEKDNRHSLSVEVMHEFEPEKE